MHRSIVSSQHSNPTPQDQGRRLRVPPRVLGQHLGRREGPDREVHHAGPRQEDHVRGGEPFARQRLASAGSPPLTLPFAGVQPPVAQEGLAQAVLHRPAQEPRGVQALQRQEEVQGGGEGGHGAAEDEEAVAGRPRERGGEGEQRQRGERGGGAAYPGGGVVGRCTNEVFSCVSQQTICTQSFQSTGYSSYLLSPRISPSLLTAPSSCCPRASCCARAPPPSSPPPSPSPSPPPSPWARLCRSSRGPSVA